MSKTVLEFRPDTGEFVRVVSTEVTIDPNYIHKMFTSQAMQVFPALKKNVFMVSRDHNMFAVVQLSKIPFRTAVSVSTIGDGTPIYLPDYRGGAEGGVRSSDVELFYEPQPGQRLFLVLDISREISYLTAMDDEGRTYYPALPNVYSDCHLCTGGSVLPDTSVAWSEGLQEYVTRWLEGWSQAEYNSDLNPEGQGSIERACVFSADTQRNVPHEDWTEWYVKVGLPTKIDQVLHAVVDELKQFNNEEGEGGESQ